MKERTKIYIYYIENYFGSQEKYYYFFKESPILKAAKIKAFISKDEAGKIFPHQHRVGCSRLEQASRIAEERFNQLPKQDFDNFEEIHHFVELVATEVKGFGDLAAYDVAVRIAKYKNCDINYVCFHAGVTIGAKRLLGLKVKNGEKLAVHKFPYPFNKLSGDHLENLLCIYKDGFAAKTKCHRTGRVPRGC